MHLMIIELPRAGWRRYYYCNGRWLVLMTGSKTSFWFSMLLLKLEDSKKVWLKWFMEGKRSVIMRA